MFACDISHFAPTGHVRGTHHVVFRSTTGTSPKGIIMAEDVVRGVANSQPVLLTRLEK
jgi:hypothetical protein